MLALPHIMTGAVVGKAVRRPWTALPVAFLSHFVLDFIPHLDTYGMFSGPSGMTRATVVAAGIDLLAGVALVIWATGRHPGRRLIFAAAFAGIFMDVLVFGPLWSEWFVTWQGTAWLSRFHGDIQHNLPPSQWPLGFGTQAVVLSATVWMLRRKEHPSPAPNET